MKNDSGSILAGLIIGAAVGWIAGVLTAPDSGSETRKKLNKRAKEYKEELEGYGEELAEKAKHLKQEMAKKIKSGREKFNEQADRFTKS